MEMSWLQHYRLYSVPTMPVGNVPNLLAGNISSKQVGNAAVYQLHANIFHSSPLLNWLMSYMNNKSPLPYLCLLTYTYRCKYAMEGELLLPYPAVTSMALGWSSLLKSAEKESRAEEPTHVWWNNPQAAL